MSDTNPDDNIDKVLEEKFDDSIKPIDTRNDGSTPKAEQAPIKTNPDVVFPDEKEDPKSKEEFLKELSDSERNFAKKGDFLDLTLKKPQLTQIRIEMGWDMKNYETDPLDLDVSLFLIDKDGKTRTNDDFVFYNNPTTLEGAVRHKFDSRTGAGEGADEVIIVDLNGIPFDITKIMIALSIYDPDMTNLNFTMVKNVFVSIIDEDEKDEIVRYELPEEELGNGSAARIAALVREGPLWFFQAIGENCHGGLSSIATDYGIIVHEMTST
jgi:tellurium resistance protein TerD